MPKSLPDLIDDMDVDGAIAETAQDAGIDRAAFFKRAGAAGATIAGAGGLMAGLPAIASAASGSLPKSDVKILNYALTLEYLESAFYTKASSDLALKGHEKSMAHVLRDHEDAHVAALKKVLGSKAVAKPRFDFEGALNSESAFIHTAFVLENLGVHAYLGQAGNIKTPAILLAAATIVTVEARHSAGIAMLLRNDDPRGKHGISPNGAFDSGYSMNKVLAAVEKTGFIVG